MPYKDLKYAEIGKITQSHGLKGHVVAHLESNIITLNPVKFIFIKIGVTLVPYQLEEATLQDDRALLKFQGIQDKFTALELVNKTIWLPEEILKTLLPKSETDEDIVGYYVTDIHQGNLGPIKRIEQFSMNRCLVIDYLNKELLIPYVPAFIQQVDHKHKQMIVQLPYGFLEAVGHK